MREHFEVSDYDGAGRLGALAVPRADVTVETPALLPVINPHVQTLSPATIEDTFGAEALITNSYILHGSDELREPALADGLHDLLGFSGAIMTDSGSFQLSEYGDIDVTTEEILQFQQDIGSDIATPVDIPTEPEASRDQAEDEQATTQDRLETAAYLETGDMLVTAPIQGSTYLDIRERAAREAAGTGLDVFPIGAVVPLMNDYRFGDLVDVVAAAKRGLPADAPVHLFGAGHPMTFALAAALGCDLFDSAAYAIYARDDRYLTVRGTKHLADLSHFPCGCEVCREHDPDEVEAMDGQRRHELLARHNLSVSFGEIRRIRQAIQSGTLFELVETRARGHPALVDGYKTLLDHAEQLEATDPVAKDTFFYLSPESARRPEVRRHQDRLSRLEVPDEVLLTEGNPSEDFDASWKLIPPFGPVPRGLTDVYPLTATRPDRLDEAAYEQAAAGVTQLVDANLDSSFTMYHDDWPEEALEAVPQSVDLAVLGEAFDEGADVADEAADESAAAPEDEE
jgi:7-cyano-7-deazaguanine tRNA-ribosyltransferase